MPPVQYHFCGFVARRRVAFGQLGPTGLRRVYGVAGRLGHRLGLGRKWPI